jgi:hypothetical protein
MKKLYKLPILIAFLCFSASPQHLLAQSINAIWGQVSPGISSPDFIKTDGEGNLIRTSFQDSMLVKVDSDGDVLWGIKFPIQPQDSAAVITGLAVDGDNNIYVAGSYKSGQIIFDNITLNADTSERLSSLFLVKYNSDGDLLWAITTGIDASPKVVAIEADGSGNVFIFGNTASESESTVFGSTTIEEGLFCVKFDQDGDIVWVNNIITVGGSVFAAGVAADGDGNSIVTGNFTGSTCSIGSTVINNSGTEGETFVFKFAPNGNALWGNAFGSASDEEWVQSITLDQDDNVYIAGHHKTPPSPVLEFFIAKYNASGVSIWDKKFTGDYDRCIAQKISTDLEGNLYMVGLFKGEEIVLGTLTLTADNSSNWLFVASFDSNGDTRWAGLEDNCIGEQIATDDEGNIYVTGNMNGPSLTLGTVILNNINTPTGNSRFLAKLNSNNTTTGIFSSEKQFIFVSPNPSRGHIKIYGLKEGLWKIQVLTMTGQLIHASEFSATELPLDLSSQPKGLYLLRLQNEKDEVMSGKIIIE